MFDRVPELTWVEHPKREYLRELATSPQSLRHLLRWLRDGRTGVPPHVIKAMRVSKTAAQHQIQRIVETGTWLGDTSAYLAARGFTVDTIELSPEIAERARNRFADFARVEVWQGDSGDVLPQVLATVNQPTLFWLDGHYSGGITAHGVQDTPITRELAAISAHELAEQHVILIDDIRCFDGHQYMYLAELLSLAQELGWSVSHIADDIATLVPTGTHRQSA